MSKITEDKAKLELMDDLYRIRGSGQENISYPRCKPLFVPTDTCDQLC